jgi:hypothetical protein
MLGQGGSLKRAAEFFHWIIPNRFQHYLQDVPPDVSPIEACVFSEVRRLGGSLTDFVRILHNPAFVIDPTEHSAVASHADFWHETVCWLINHREAITDEQSNLILSWAMHEYTETEYQQQAQPFFWKGRSVAAVLERSLEYHRRVQRPWTGYKWNNHGWDWEIDQAQFGKWSFVELTTGEDLFYEGDALHHCVTTYAGRCASGYSAIVSLRLDGIRRLTVEINPKTKQVVQARGIYNREAQIEERNVLGKWIKVVLRPDTSD